jgi:acyl carrier protein
MTVHPGANAPATQAELAAILTRAAGLSPEAIADAGDNSLQDLGLDSLAAMELQAAVKDRYQVQIPDESLGMSFPEITRYVLAQLGNGA